MPHAILRALRHRSTPTLLPSTADRQQQQHQQQALHIPSIFITVPDEEGAHHWCALAGTTAPPGIHPGFDVPLPDFAALEETIAKLKRAGETPTFRRPGRRDDVVLPKKKYTHDQVQHHHHQQQQHYVHSKSNAAVGAGAGVKRPRPRRPQTSPITRRERARLEGNNVNDDPFAASSVREGSGMRVDTAEQVTVPGSNGRFTPTSVLRSLSKSGKKQKHRPPPVFTSVSYESVVSQPFSAPAQYDSFSRKRTSQDSVPKQKKRSSLGWFFSTSSKRASVPVVGEDVEALEMVTEQDGDAVGRSYARNMVVGSTSKIALNEQSVEYTMPACFEEDHADQPPMSPVDTHESDLDKPLPPIPKMPVLAPDSEEEAPAAELEINDSVQVQVVMAINDAFKHVDFPTTMGVVPQPQPTGEVPSNPTAPTEKEKEKKVKRKFSLKRLRERFLSGPSPNPLSTEAQDIPPVPALPPTILMALPTSGPIDPPFMPPALPLDSPFTHPSLTDSLASSPGGPIDPPFTPPPILTYDSLPTSEDSSSEVAETTTTMAAAKSTESPVLRVTDEDSNVSTSSEDSGSSAASSSTPDSTPPDTPDSARIGPVFGLLQGKDGVKESFDGQHSEVDVTCDTAAAATVAGIKRSSGMRRQLDSLRFGDMGFVPAAA